MYKCALIHIQDKNEIQSLMEVEAENKEYSYSYNGYSSGGHNILTSDESVMVKDLRVAE